MEDTSMLTTMEKKNMKRTNLTLICLLALALSSAGMASARDYDGRRPSDRDRVGHSGPRHNDTGAVTAAYRADVRLDRHGAAIDHHFDFVALVSAVAGDYRLAHALDRRGDRIEYRYDRRGNRIFNHAKARHRHHDRCGHHRSSWHENRHHVKHARGHGHGHRRAKGHGHGHRGHKGKGHKGHH
jgi:hypothetical protein